MHKNIRLKPESNIFYDSSSRCWKFVLLSTFEHEECTIKVDFFQDELRLLVRKIGQPFSGVPFLGLKEFLPKEPVFLTVMEKIKEAEKKMKTFIEFEKITLQQNAEESILISFIYKENKLKKFYYDIDENLKFTLTESVLPSNISHSFRYVARLKREINNRGIRFILFPESRFYRLNHTRPIPDYLLNFSFVTYDHLNDSSLYHHFEEDVIEKAVQHPALRVKLLTT